MLKSSDSPSLPLSLAALICLAALPGCSKGGDGTGGGTCRRIGDPDPGMMQQGPTPTGLYAELLEPISGTVLPVNLDGVSGGYSGTTANFDKCADPTGTYYVQRTFLFDLKKNLVATALRDPASGGYRVLYQNGMSTLVSGANFSSNYTSVSGTTGSPPTLQAVSVGGPSTRQGDKVTVTSSAMAAMDDCGISQMEWWLTTNPGQQLSPVVSATITGGSGSGTMRIPPDLSPATYYVEGRLVSKQGRAVQIRRQSTGDANYMYLNDMGQYSATSIPVISLAVTANPAADQQAPQAVSMQATPTTVDRCQQVQLVLNISDDKALPASQQVTVLLGPIDQPGLVQAKLSGSGTLSGLFTVPLDAPPGVWFGYPQSIVDDAGNVGTGSLSNGKFTISGPGISSPAQVQAATFVVQGPTGTSTPDLGTQVTPDGGMMVSPFPASLIGVSVSPQSIMGGQAATVSVTWMDNSDPKILK